MSRKWRNKVNEPTMKEYKTMDISYTNYTLLCKRLNIKIFTFNKNYIEQLYMKRLFKIRHK